MRSFIFILFVCFSRHIFCLHCHLEFLKSIKIRDKSICARGGREIKPHLLEIFSFFHSSLYHNMIKTNRADCSEIFRILPYQDEKTRQCIHNTLGFKQTSKIGVNVFFSPIHANRPSIILLEINHLNSQKVSIFFF